MNVFSQKYLRCPEFYRTTIILMLAVLAVELNTNLDYNGL